MIIKAERSIPGHSDPHRPIFSRFSLCQPVRSGHRRWQGQAWKLENPLDIGVLLQESCQEFRIMILLKAHNQPQMTAFHLHFLIPGQGSEDGFFQASLEHFQMPHASHPVEYRPLQPHPLVEARKSQLHGGRTSRHAMHIDNQENGYIEDFGHLSSAANLCSIHAVE